MTAGFEQGPGGRVDAAARAGSSWVERLARIGYAAKGAVYVLVGVLAARAAFGSGGETTDSSGALQSLTDEPFGQIMLWVLGLGLAAYALWRAFSAVVDPEDHDGAKGIVVRIAYGISALLHAGLAREAIRLATGSGGGGGGSGAEHWTSRVLSAPLGPYLVGAAGAIIVAFGLFQLYRAFQSDIAKRLRLGSVDPDHRDIIVRLGRAGLAARGVVFALIGFFTLQAAVSYDPQEAGGIGQALQWLQRQDYSTVLLGAVALGLVAYGVFQFVKAKYRVISTA